MEKKRHLHLRAFKELSKRNRWEEACDQILELRDWELLAGFLDDRGEDLLIQGKSGILNRFTHEIPRTFSTVFRNYVFAPLFPVFRRPNHSPKSSPAGIGGV